MLHLLNYQRLTIQTFTNIDTHENQLTRIKMTTGKFLLFNFIVDTNDERRVIGIIEQSLGQGSAAFLFLTFLETSILFDITDY